MNGGVLSPRTHAPLKEKEIATLGTVAAKRPTKVCRRPGRRVSRFPELFPRRPETERDNSAWISTGCLAAVRAVCLLSVELLERGLSFSCKGCAESVVSLPVFPCQNVFPEVGFSVSAECPHARRHPLLRLCSFPLCFPWNALVALPSLLVAWPACVSSVLSRSLLSLPRFFSRVLVFSGVVLRASLHRPC